jgi:predicted nucleic acid-binding protein
LILLDTSAVIPVLAGDERVLGLALGASARLAVSTLTVAELQAGIARSASADRAVHERRLDIFLSDAHVLSLGLAQVAAYRAILDASGFSRRKLLDRLIAAAALIDRLPLATLNPADFADVPDLRVIDWS